MKKIIMKKIGYYNIMNKKYNRFTIYKLRLSCQKCKVLAACFYHDVYLLFSRPALSVSTVCLSFEGDKLISKQKSLKSVTMKLICKKAALSFYLCTCREKGEEKKRTLIVSMQTITLRWLAEVE